jgi:hypothetical protein
LTSLYSSANMLHITYMSSRRVAVVAVAVVTVARVIAVV